MNFATEDASLTLIKERWNAVLDAVLAENRIAWLAYFDARITGLSHGVLALSFADSEKFSGDHNYTAVRNPAHEELLIKAITDVTGHSVQIREER